MTYVTFSPGAFLGGDTTCDRKQHGLVLLNQPITDMELFKRAWTFCERRICADGGANRLFDALKTDEERLKFLPDVIVGDFDSLRDNVRQWYEEHGVMVKHDKSQDTTDFMKAVTLGNELYQVHGLLVLGALGGRLDHTFHSIFHLFLSLKHHQTVYLLNDACVSFLLHPNVPNIVKTPQNLLGKAVGIIPIAGPTRITTKGLQWDVEDWETSFYTQISTSNYLVADQVTVESPDPVLFTIEFKFNELHGG